MLFVLDIKFNFLNLFINHIDLYLNFLSYFLILLLYIQLRLKNSIEYCIDITALIIHDFIFNIEDSHDLIFWWEPWSYEILECFPPFEKKFLNTPWFSYYYYRLESWTRWHILEDRICIFILFFLFILS